MGITRCYMVWLVCCFMQLHHTSLSLQLTDKSNYWHKEVSCWENVNTCVILSVWKNKMECCDYSPTVFCRRESYDHSDLKKRKQYRPRQAVIKTVWSLNNAETSSMENTGRDCQPWGNMTAFNPADNRSAGRAHRRLRRVWLKQRGMWFGVKVLISWSLSLYLCCSLFLPLSGIFLMLQWHLHVMCCRNMHSSSAQTFSSNISNYVKI